MQLRVLWDFFLTNILGAIYDLRASKAHLAQFGWKWVGLAVLLNGNPQTASKIFFIFEA